HAKLEGGKLLASNGDHAVRQINTGDLGAAMAELLREVASAAPGVEHTAAANVPGQRPQNGVGVQAPVGVAFGADLDLPIVGDAIPEVTDLIVHGAAPSLLYAHCDRRAALSGDRNDDGDGIPWHNAIGHDEVELIDAGVAGREAGERHLRRYA